MYGWDGKSIYSIGRRGRNGLSVATDFSGGKCRIARPSTGLSMTAIVKTAIVGVTNAVLAALLVLPALVIDSVQATQSHDLALEAESFR
jgi:hypothetical protein